MEDLLDEEFGPCFEDDILFLMQEYWAERLAKAPLRCEFGSMGKLTVVVKSSLIYRGGPRQYREIRP